MKLRGDMFLSGAADSGFGSLIRGYPTTYTNPAAFLVELVSHYRNLPDWFKEAPLTRDQAETIAAKYAYYMGKKSFPNTRPGRIAAAAAISRDMGGLNPVAIFSALDNFDRYLQKHSQQFPDADILKWFYMGQKKNAVDAVGQATGKIVAAPLTVALDVVRASGNEIEKALPWWARPGVIIPGGLALLGIFAVLEIKTGKVSSAAKAGARLAAKAI